MEILGKSLNIGNISIGVLVFLLLNYGIPAILNFLNIDASHYFTPVQIFGLAYLILFLLLPKKTVNPFE